MKAAYIVDAVRTPIGKFAGSLSNIRADDLAAIPIRALLDRQPDLDPEAIEDVVMGCANQAGEDNRNVARMAGLLAGLPRSVPGETVNRLCASGLSAVVQAARAIQVGDGDFYLAGGVEHMTRAPYVLSKSGRAFGRDAQLYDTSLGWRFINPKMADAHGVDAMGETAENVADRFQITRDDQDLFAYRSQSKAAQARSAGRFDREIVSVSIPRRKAEPLIFDQDEFLRPETTVETLAKLRPAFRKEGTVTAGNSSGINDGACAVLLASEEGLNRFNLKPRGKVVGGAVVGVEPAVMGIGPVEAVRKVLKRTGLDLDGIDLIELNEAFAAQSLACLREWGLADDDPRVNPNGGAIALGHPLGMSGARLVTTALYEMEARQLKRALCTMCVGVGQGMAAVIERV